MKHASTIQRSNTMFMAAVGIFVLSLVVSLLFGLGFCAESAHEPLPVGETG